MVAERETTKRCGDEATGDAGRQPHLILVLPIGRKTASAYEANNMAHFLSTGKDSFPSIAMRKGLQPN